MTPTKLKVHNLTQKMKSMETQMQKAFAEMQKDLDDLVADMENEEKLRSETEQGKELSEVKKLDLELDKIFTHAKSTDLSTFILKDVMKELGHDIDSEWSLKIAKACASLSFNYGYETNDKMSMFSNGLNFRYRRINP